MKTFSINDRVSYQGEKATVKQVWKKKVRVILSDLRCITVGIDEISPADEAISNQLPLIDLSQYQPPDRTITQWDLENEDSIGTVTSQYLDTGVIETLTPDGDQSEDSIEIDIRSLPTHRLTQLHEVIARELHYRGEGSLPNPLPTPHPNPLPNPHPNPLPNPHPNPLPNSLPNSLPNPLPTPHPNPLPNPHPNPHPNPLPNPHPNPHPNPLPNSLPNSHPSHGYEEIKTIKRRQYRYWRWSENGKLRSKYLGRVASLVK